MDDDSLSRRAADITADLNHQAALDRLSQSTWPQHGGGSTSASGVGGGSSIGIGSAIVIALVISAVAGGFGGADWFTTALMLSGGFVVVLFAVTTLVRLRRKGDTRIGGTGAVGARSVGFLATVLLGAIAGAALGSLVPTVLGDDITTSEGIFKLTPVGTAVGVILAGVRSVRRR